MLFFGDIAHPFDSPPDWSAASKICESNISVVNLEGALAPDCSYLPQPKLFNHISVLSALRAINTSVVCLANNHITDISQGATRTASRLVDEGMLPVGGGRNFKMASEPAILQYEGQTYIFVAFGWPTIQCMPSGEAKEGVNALNPRRVLETVETLRRQWPDAAIVAMFHWNIELERHPQPAHRQLAFAVIDRGANLVIGHHPHCVGGFETYRGCPIAYSLGDWWIPQGVFFGGRLGFPDYTLRQVVFDWTLGGQPVLHWFDYDRDSHAVTHLSSEPLEQSREAKALTPFAGLSHRDYNRWFEKNRLKRKALPIYRDYRHQIRNQFRDQFIGVRHKMIVLGRKYSGFASSH